MATVTKISTGFLSGNLFNDTGYDEAASADNYAHLLRNALEDAFPDAEISVVYQRASGELPYACKTQVYFYTDTPDHQEEKRIIETVEQIMGDVYERFDEWAIKETE